MSHLREFVTTVPEYRRTSKGNYKHKLEDIVMLVIMARLSNTTDIICIDGKAMRGTSYENGCIVTADAMSFQKTIIDKIREKGGDFVIELKVNQRSLRYGLEDGIKTASPIDVYKEVPFLEHGRIESRTCRIYDGSELIADRKKWSGDLTVLALMIVHSLH